MVHMNNAIELTLYSRAGCHLCMDMEARLEILGETHQFNLNIIDIDTDAVLQQKYNADVPVLAFKNEIVCIHFMDETSFEALFNLESSVGHSEPLGRS